MPPRYEWLDLPDDWYSPGKKNELVIISHSIMRSVLSVLHLPTKGSARSRDVAIRKVMD